MADVYIYPSTATEQDCNTGLGYGALTALSAPVTEELLVAGQTGLFLAPRTVISVNDPLAEHFKAGAILGLSTPRGRDYFRIRVTNKTLRDITAEAWHVSYDLADGLIADRAWDNYALSDVWEDILQAGGNTGFTGMSDIVDVSGVRIVRRNVIDAIMGDQDNSVLNRWGGELDRHGWRVDMLARLGQNRGTAIRYGMNLTGLDDLVDTSEMYHAVLPTYLDGDTPVQMPVIECPGYVMVERPKTVAIHFGDIRVGTADGEYQTRGEAEQAVANRVDDLWVKGAHRPRASARIEFFDLRKIPEYADLSFLEQIGLGDTIRAVWEGHLDIEQRVIRYEWDACRDRYISIEMGQPARNITALTNRLESILSGEVGRQVTAVTSPIIDAALRLNEVYAAALGYHQTVRVNEATGARMLYMHDQPALEDSTFIATVPEAGTYLWTDQGWNDGEPVWTSGTTKDGNALFRKIVAEGVEIGSASSEYSSEILPDSFRIKYRGMPVMSIAEDEMRIPKVITSEYYGVGRVKFIPSRQGNAIVGTDLVYMDDPEDL